MVKETEKSKAIEKKLRSSYRNQRLEGWTHVREDFVDDQKPMQPSLRSQLLESLGGEEDEDVFRFAVTVLLGVPFPGRDPTVDPAEKLSGNNVETLDEWVWSVFHSPSVVLSVSEKGFIRRDAPAMIDLSRKLNFKDFEKADVRLIRPEEPDWRHQIVEKGYQSICFVGRLGLYGDEAVDRWSNPHARFSFGLHRRPNNLPPNELHPEYHCIYERIGDVDTERYRSVDENGTRTDYGIVQRYPVFDGTTTMVVVNCAGESALGTYAAVQWAAVELSKPTHPDIDEPIKAPQGISPDSYMEALIEVKAQITSHVWRPTQITLHKLYVDRAAWNKMERRWEIDRPRKITIVRNNGKTVDILFDGKPTSQLKSSQSFRLLDHVCRNVYERKDNIVDVEKLATTDEIWDKSCHSERRVRSNLWILKSRYLGDALSSGAPIRLHADVEIRDV